ncbi:MAG: FAD-dependent oxidoreductase [Mariprofundus sp.]|nr:FAD-dependent oxidoreductase [Mariprofundus sp.]
MNTRYDMIVVGAGISGLAMAFEAKQAGLNVLVLEKEAQLGGCFHSALVLDHAQIPDDEQGFWLEMGTHTCFNSYGRLLNLLKRLALIDQMQPREKLRYRLWVDGAMCSIPSRLHFFELIRHAWRMFSLEKKDISVADYYGAVVGPANYDEVFQHALAAVLCQPVADVPADMLFRKRPRDKSITRSYTFAGGLSDIITALAEQLTVKNNQQISSIQFNGPDHSEQCYTIETAAGVYHCNQLVCATPALAASRLLKDAHADIAEQLGWVHEVEIESVAVAIDKKDLSLPAMAGVIAIDGDFYSAVSRDFIEHPRWRGFTFHFKPGVLNEAEKTQRICDVLQLKQAALAHVFHHTNRLPAPDMGHHALTHGLDAALLDQPLALVGNYFDGVAVEDCLERVEKEFARLSR